MNLIKVAIEAFVSTVRLSHPEVLNVTNREMDAEVEKKTGETWDETA